MTLYEIREKFIQLSGRYDLVVDAVDYEDQGADYFIKNGQRWLDSTYHLGRSDGSHFFSLAVGDWYAIIPYCRVIRYVYAGNTDNERFELYRRTVPQLRELFSESLASEDSGTPIYYAQATFRAVPETADTIVVDSLSTTAVTVSSDLFTNNGILIAPKTDAALRIEVNGIFGQPYLVLDDDENYWSSEQDYALVMAAMRALEISYRNTAGVNDWEGAIAKELMGAEFDLADVEASGKMRMEG